MNGCLLSRPGRGPRYQALKNSCISGPVSSTDSNGGLIVAAVAALGSQTAVTRRWIQREQRKWNPAKITVLVRLYTICSLLVAQNILKMGSNYSL